MKTKYNSLDRQASGVRETGRTMNKRDSSFLAAQAGYIHIIRVYDPGKQVFLPNRYRFYATPGLSAGRKGVG